MTSWIEARSVCYSAVLMPNKGHTQLRRRELTTTTAAGIELIEVFLAWVLLDNILMHS